MLKMCQCCKSNILRLSALVNKGNVLYQKGDYEKAREYYREALNNDSSCVEGLYNLGNKLFYRPRGPKESCRCCHGRHFPWHRHPHVQLHCLPGPRHCTARVRPGN